MYKNKHERAYGFYLLTNEYFSTEYEKLLKNNDLLKQDDRVNYVQQRLNDELNNLSQEEINLVNTIMKSNILNFIQKRMMLVIGIPRLFPIKLKDQLEHILVMSGIGKEWTELLYSYVLLGSLDETLAPSSMTLPSDKEYEDGAIWWLFVRKKFQGNTDQEHKRANHISYVSIGEEIFGAIPDDLSNKEQDYKADKLDQVVRKRISDFRRKFKITSEWEEYLFSTL